MAAARDTCIMIVDFARQRVDRGERPDGAIHEASLERFRPILMTTLAGEVHDHDAGVPGRCHDGLAPLPDGSRVDLRMTLSVSLHSPADRVPASGLAPGGGDLDGGVTDDSCWAIGGRRREKRRMELRSQAFQAPRSGREIPRIGLVVPATDELSGRAFGQMLAGHDVSVVASRVAFENPVAQLWEALSLIGYAEPVRGFGRLLLGLAPVRAA